jgi:hypothetical protein
MMLVLTLLVLSMVPELGMLVQCSPDVGAGAAAQ